LISNKNAFFTVIYILSPTMSLNKNAFTLVIDPHTGLISNKNAFFTVIYILV
jgi:hypothetical protein